MIKFENTEVLGWEQVIRGMRNHMNVTEDIESGPTCTGRCGDDMNCPTCDQVGYYIGPKDYRLLKRITGDPRYTNYRKMITVYVDITAPLYFWKELDACRIGAISNSCDSIDDIMEEEFTLEDFSHEHLINSPLVESKPGVPELYNMQAKQMLTIIIGVLNAARFNYLKTKDKKYWWQMVQLLPSSYNQTRIIMLNYEELAGFYSVAENSDLDEWKEFGKWIEKCLPYSEFITMKEPEQPVWGASSL